MNPIASTVGTIVNSSNTVQRIMIDFNVIGVALGVLIGNNVVDLVNAINDGVIMPSLQPLLDMIQGGKKDTKEDTKEDTKGDTKERNFVLFGLKLNLTALFTALIKFITIAIIILFFLNLGTSLLDTPSTNVVIIGVEPGVKLNGK